MIFLFFIFSEMLFPLATKKNPKKQNKTKPSQTQSRNRVGDISKSQCEKE